MQLKLVSRGTGLWTSTWWGAWNATVL